jgi:hypothetical protein
MTWHCSNSKCRKRERKCQPHFDTLTLHFLWDLFFARLLVTPSNTQPRSLAAGAPPLQSHVYDYAAGGPARYTLLFIVPGRVDEPKGEENLWPPWADLFWNLLIDRCPDVATVVTAQAQVQPASVVIAQQGKQEQQLFPCFRELRPAGTTGNR